ncbi:MAG TPA: vWA domain-containing protein [Spirochaetia bacterium]
MNGQRLLKTGIVVVFALALGAGVAFADERIQLAILLDTSNSMDGLIGQAKSQLWKVVNELARASRGGRHPRLEVALFEYGNNGLSASSGYIRMVSDLTTDLDAISEDLFGLTTNGGSEYCGMVIDRAVDRLSWSGSNDVLKVIYIAGNEPFTQGPLPYRTADARAVRRGIVVNTIFCGTNDEGIETGWKDGADRGGGRYMSIDQDEVVVDPATPWDDEIVRLGDALNKTYVGYGSAGAASKSRQEAQDSNAASMGAAAPVERSVAKAQSAYSNAGWDLLDALDQKRVSLGSLKDDELPSAMRGMTMAQKGEYVKKLAAERVELQKKINAANEKRRAFIVEAQKASATASGNTLDQAILSSVREEATKKGFTIE